jgi:tRNA(Arg) A34 adenosine deaminase TadA
MYHKHSECSFRLPEWLIEYENTLAGKHFSNLNDENKMEVAIEISRQNILRKTGGPFGCAIFKNNGQYSTLISVGSNLVTSCKNCTLHGEMTAIQIGQKRLQTFSFSSERCELFTSCAPCAMCIGAILWSGVSKVVCAAEKNDAEAIGFKEGPVFDESYKYLNESGIEVKHGVMRDKAVDILNLYDGAIYNGV